MKAYRKLPQLDEFKAYSSTAAAGTRAIERDYNPEETLTRSQRITSWSCRLIAAAIMIETLFYKFTGAQESVYIFTRMHMEPWWRYGQGIWELVASLLLLTPRLGWAGAILTLGAMGAAILSHLTVLGIAVQGDHGLLFAMAMTTFACAFTAMVIHRHEIPFVTPLSSW